MPADWTAPASAGRRRPWPTAGDLLRAVEPYVRAECLASAEIQANVRGALTLRARALSDTPALNAEHGLLARDLMGGNHVIQLAQLGDEVGAFAGMVLLARLLRASRDLGARPLHTVLIVEEAHALLTDRRTGETTLFGRMYEQALAELRASGIGIVTVEQRPSLLPAGVLANSVTRVCFASAHAHDREAVGKALGLTDYQQRLIGSLEPGTALVATAGSAVDLVATAGYAQGAPRASHPAAAAPAHEGSVRRGLGARLCEVTVGRRGSDETGGSETGRSDGGSEVGSDGGLTTETGGVTEAGGSSGTETGSGGEVDDGVAEAPAATTEVLTEVSSDDEEGVIEASETAEATDGSSAEFAEVGREIDGFEGMLAGVNENFDPHDLSSPYAENCGSCVLAVEARLSGADPEAVAGATPIFTVAEMNQATGMEQTAMTPAEIEAYAVAQGPGYHGVAGFDWVGSKNSGHWVNIACSESGRVYVLDGQVGRAMLLSEYVDVWYKDQTENWDLSIPQKKGTS